MGSEVPLTSLGDEVERGNAIKKLFLCTFLGLIGEWQTNLITEKMNRC